MNRGCYTGVGSRRAPPEMVNFATSLATVLSTWGLRVRSGGADGMDTGFERGDPWAEVFVPWNGYNGRWMPQNQVGVPLRAYDIAKSTHPAWNALSSGARKLHARNVQQVLGFDLNNPSKFLICWTPDGCETEAERTRETGGTATAIIVAARHSIPVFNLAKPGSYDRLVDFLPSLL